MASNKWKEDKTFHQTEDAFAYSANKQTMKIGQKKLLFFFNKQTTKWKKDKTFHQAEEAFAFSPSRPQPPSLSRHLIEQNKIDHTNMIHIMKTIVGI